MARSQSIPASSRLAQMMLAAQTEIRNSADALGDCQAALNTWASEIQPEPETLSQAAVGVQAEAVRVAMYAQAIRAASERLAIVAQLVKDGAP